MSYDGRPPRRGPRGRTSSTPSPPHLFAHVLLQMLDMYVIVSLLSRIITSINICSIITID